jgi:formamidopyrimidine-DNA glycosylase
VPELPEVEALAADLRDQVVGRRIARVDLAAISALKTFDPPRPRCTAPR